jgi:protein-L-isoaspartate(D-aspartate) O-methyltransferase
MVAAQLRGRGIADERVLAAMDRVPRELFVPAARADDAYADGPLPIGCGQTISQPYMVALSTMLAQLPPGGRVLEVGTGSGYQAAVLAQLAAQVVSIERHASLATSARAALAAAGVTNVEVRVGDGSLGVPDRAPFDAIVVTAAAPAIPPALIEQLAPGGRLVIPTGDRALQRMRVVTRGPGDTLRVEDHEACRYVPLVGAQGFEDAD